MTNTDVGVLLISIRDVIHNKKDPAQSTMGLFERDMALCITPMKTKHTLDNYYCVFKAQVDTSKAHGSNPGYHGAVYCDHYETLTVGKGYNTKVKLDAVGDTEEKKMRAKALKSSAGAYLRCLFLMMANKMYKPVKSSYTRLSLRKNNNTRVMCWP